MMNRSTLILTTSPRSQPAKNPDRTPSPALRQRPLYERKRHYHTGKERDSETGLYYYGARYLDSKTSRWLSGDPAMGDYVPEAPVSDEARKRNGNLPGMGGVFNVVNLHTYHYAGNNPVKLVDPDGRNSGIAIDDNGALGAGHIAGFVHLGDDRWAVFEFTGISDDPELEKQNGIPENATPGRIYKDKYGNDVFVLTNNKNIIPPAKFSKNNLGMPPNAGYLLRFFDSAEARDAFFKKAGYTRSLEFNTTKTQDKRIMQNIFFIADIKDFGYFLTSHNCGTFLRDIFSYGTTGINIMPTKANRVPKVLFFDLGVFNLNNTAQRKSF